MTLTRRVFEEKRSLIVAVVIALALNAVLFAAVVYPLSLKVAAGEAGAQAASNRAMVARRDYESARNTVSGKVAADAELKKFYRDVLPPDQSAAQRITFLKIQQLAAKTKVTYVRSANDIVEARDSSLGELATTVTLTGQYRDIRHFIYELETAPEFLVIETVALTQGTDVAATLTVTVKVAIYYQAGGNGI